VLKAAHDADVDHLVHMSSVGTYAAGAYGRRVDESWSAAGIASSVYSRTKSAAEALLDDLPRTASPDPSEAIRVRRIARRTRGAAVPDAEQVGDDGV
jgi:UDP-glucose 4-epimerase